MALDKNDEDERRLPLGQWVVEKLVPANKSQEEMLTAIVNRVREDTDWQLELDFSPFSRALLNAIEDFMASGKLEKAMQWLDAYWDVAKRVKMREDYPQFLAAALSLEAQLHAKRDDPEAMMRTHALLWKLLKRREWMGDVTWSRPLLLRLEMNMALAYAIRGNCDVCEQLAIDLVQQARSMCIKLPERGSAKRSIKVSVEEMQQQLKEQQMRIVEQQQIQIWQNQQQQQQQGKATMQLKQQQQQQPQETKQPFVLMGKKPELQHSQSNHQFHNRNPSSTLLLDFNMQVARDLVSLLESSLNIYYYLLLVYEVPECAPVMKRTAKALHDLMVTISPTAVPHWKIVKARARKTAEETRAQMDTLESNTSYLQTQAEKLHAAFNRPPNAPPLAPTPSGHSKHGPL